MSFSRYQYKGFWIEIFLETDFQQKNFWYEFSIEMPNWGEGVIRHSPYVSSDQAEFAAEELIESWN